MTRMTTTISVVAIVLSATASAASGPAAQVGSLTTHTGTVLNGSPTVSVGGLPAARAGDLASCPLPFHIPVSAIVGGSSTVRINGLPAARVGDVTADGPPATITLGANTVIIGD